VRPSKEALQHRQVFSEANQDKYGKIITADDLAQGEKTEDLPEQKPADSEEQAVQGVHLVQRIKTGCYGPTPRGGYRIRPPQPASLDPPPKVQYATGASIKAAVSLSIRAITYLELLKCNVKYKRVGPRLPVSGRVSADTATAALSGTLARATKLA
jgi:hypothetical protein